MGLGVVGLGVGTQTPIKSSQHELCFAHFLLHWQILPGTYISSQPYPLQLAAVGLGVGLAVGLDVGVDVGLGVGSGFSVVGASVGLGVGVVGAGVGLGVGKHCVS